MKKKYKRKKTYQLGVHFEPAVGEMFENAILQHNKKNPLKQLTRSSVVRDKVAEFILENS